MEKFKGFLKRKSGGTISDMEVVSDPDNTSETSPNNDDTRALMMDKIEQLTSEKYSLEDTLSTMKYQLESVTQENLDLQSRCDDLERSLELEKRRFKWQQRFYERRIRQLTGLPTNPTIESTPQSENPEDSNISDMSIISVNDEETNRLRQYQSMEDLTECNHFYEEMIKALVQVQESQNQEINHLKKFYEDRLKALSLEHEAGVTEILEASNFEVQKLVNENEALIRDLLTGCEGLFDELKEEYTEEAKSNTEIRTSSGQNIIVQFKALPTPIKGIVVAGITVISVATAGWCSWGFIIWVWPRLIAFAEVLAANPESSLLYLMAFLNSAPFQSFTKSWEEGKSLGECLKAFANTEFLTSALRMAPDLFNQFKNFKRPLPVANRL